MEFSVVKPGIGGYIIRIPIVNYLFLILTRR
jgi:hypothetical protein